jgi:phthiocerol/phenolphthiocerol synthesis type-I polyketide synthase E
LVPTSEDRANTDLEIAIIGMAARLPGSSNLRQFWHNLLAGREGISFFSDDELLASGVDPRDFNRSKYVKAASILKDCEMFDPDFFGITPKEAELMDPQHRVFLECAWEAFEDAGYIPDTFPGLVGVFAGASISSYFFSQVVPNMERTAALGLFLTALSNDKDYLPLRTSYKLNLKGPSISVGTACSTSLVATHLACKSLLGGECDMALAGGSSIRFPTKAGYLYQDGGILSPDGHCRAFDERAQGTVCGSGVGAVLLKRLEDAIEHGDHIYAIIKGSATNNDGYRKIGFTAPSVEGQAEVIRLAHLMAEVSPETISYIEAHGTGTPIGDPIELQGLTEAFRTTTSRNQFCAIGSVKTNLGHLDAAAGVTGLIKTALALKHRTLPPSLHFTRPNPKLNIGNTPFYVNDKLREWTAPSSDQPLRAGVSSFGIGGTNAHVILEEPPRLSSNPSLRNCHLLTLSARSPKTLEQVTASLGAHLEQSHDINMADVAYTSHVGRKAFPYRLALVCRSRDDAIALLNAPNSSRCFRNDGVPAESGTALLLSGEGLLDRRAVTELYHTEPAFRKHADECLSLITDEAKNEVRNVFTGSSSRACHTETDIAQTVDSCRAHVAFITEFALAQLWIHWGLEFRAIIGHGIGEFVAGCVAGIFSLKDALRMIAIRENLLKSRPMFDARKLPHSAAIESLFAEALQQFQMNPPRLQYMSMSKGDWITPAEARNSQYWAEQLRDSIDFDPVVTKLLNKGVSTFLEVGPESDLAKCLIKYGAPEGKKRPTVLRCLPSIHQDQSAASVLLSCTARLWLEGWVPNWANFHSEERRSRIPLPTYPFERTLCRLAPAKESSMATERIEERAPEKSFELDPDFRLASIGQKTSSEDWEPEIPTRAELQGKIADIWRQLLGIEDIGLEDDFFDLGGDSLLIVQFVSRLLQIFPVELPLGKIYDEPTVAGIAGLLEGSLLQNSQIPVG